MADHGPRPSADTARAVLRESLEQYRATPHRILVRLLGTVIDQTITQRTVGTDGLPYVVEVQFLWDGHPGSDVRVVVEVWRWDGERSSRALAADDFIKAPDGSFVDEDHTSSRS